MCGVCTHAWCVCALGMERIYIVCVHARMCRYMCTVCVLGCGGICYDMLEVCGVC